MSRPVLLLEMGTACASWSSLRSETSIDAGKEFLLRGSQGRRFSATVQNTGAVPVAVFVETKGEPPSADRARA